MDHLFPYIPSGVILLTLVAVKVSLSQRPTWKDTERTYISKEMCEERKRAADQVHDEIKRSLSVIESDIKKILTKIGDSK